MPGVGGVHKAAERTAGGEELPRGVWEFGKGVGILGQECHSQGKRQIGIWTWYLWE